MKIAHELSEENLELLCRNFSKQKKESLIQDQASFQFRSSSRQREISVNLHEHKNHSCVTKYSSLLFIPPE